MASATLMTINDRLSVHRSPRAEQVASFADGVRAGLGAPAKSLPSMFFYDELGSALFAAICKLPEYSLTRAEREILKRGAHEIVARLHGPIDLVELGSGSAEKTRYLIEAAIERQGALHYKPIDISTEALMDSAWELVAAHPELRVTAYAGDYHEVMLEPGLHGVKPVLALFLGSNIGNFAPHDAHRLLKTVRGALRKGDALLLGTDLKKSSAILEAAYADEIGVTAAFNKNLLARINRELGGHFDLATFEHVARYDEERAAVDSHLRSRLAQLIRIDALDMAVKFEAGETIYTESSYKYDRQSVEELAALAGFGIAETWYDSGRSFALHLLEVR